MSQNNQQQNDSTRGKNWEEEEDLQLCSPWITISHDPIAGADQRADTYWARIKLHYDARIPDSFQNRTWKSLKSRWSTIKSKVSVFSSCVSQIKNANISGISEKDEVCMVVINLCQ